MQQTITYEGNLSITTDMTIYILSYTSLYQSRPYTMLRCILIYKSFIWFVMEHMKERKIKYNENYLKIIHLKVLHLCVEEEIRHKFEETSKQKL